MKKLVLIISFVYVTATFGQDHFAGINTSTRVSILNANNNPAELANLSKKIEINIYGLSFNVANNKIGFSDLTSDTNLEDKLFEGTEPVNFRFDGEIIGPSVAIGWKKWGFGFTTKAHAKFDLVDINTNIGNAILNSNSNLMNSSTISNNNNQRINGTTWGEVGLSAARTVYENEKHRLSVGLAVKFLFPGSYSNFGFDQFQGTITVAGGQAYLNNTTATLNIAYSGNLADSFTNFDDYSKSIFGSLNGAATDIGFNYQWKDGKKKYKINAGLAIKNIGSMDFKDSNNSSTTYSLSIFNNALGLNLNLFENIDNLQEVETILQNNGYLTTIKNENDFTIKLPTVISLYSDFKIVPKFYVTLFTQQKLNSDNRNDQITSQNLISMTPRFSLGFFEAYSTWSNNEISGVNGGIGFRLYGFYIGSSSVITALANDSKQADLYMGFRWAFL
jgi:hypothetical protein